MDLGLEIQSQRSNVDESGAMVNSNFSLFKAPTNEGIDRLPPLNVPFGEYRQNGRWASFAFAKNRLHRDRQTAIAF